MQPHLSTFTTEARENISHLLVLSILSFLILLPTSSSSLPFADFLGLLAFVDALLVDAEYHAADKGEDHNHNGTYGPCGHWIEERKEVESQVGGVLFGRK